MVGARHGSDAERAEQMPVQLAEFSREDVPSAGRRLRPQPQRPVPEMIVDSGERRRGHLPGRRQGGVRLIEDQIYLHGGAGTDPWSPTRRGGVPAGRAGGPGRNSGGPPLPQAWSNRPARDHRHRRCLGENLICCNGGVCTAILSIEPGAPVLLAGIRDEFFDRAWLPPGPHWPDHRGLIGGRDLLAGGTWLALAPAERRVACVLNGRGRMAPVTSRRSRGVLPLQVAADGMLERAHLADFDPFHLLSAQPGLAVLWSWDGERLTERELAPGLHIVVNSGLGGDLPARAASGPARPGERDDRSAIESRHEQARIAHFLPRLRAAPRPVPQHGGTAAQAWGPWLPLINGDGIPPHDPRALIVRHDLSGERTWGTTSISLVALWEDGMRYDFTGAPGGAAAWYAVRLGSPWRESGSQCR